MAADWNAIKIEYISNPNTSYRKLAEKYGVHFTNIAKKAKEENWQQERIQHANTTLTNTLDAITNDKVDRAVRLQSVAEKLLEKIEALIDYTEAPQSIRHLTAALKDIKEIQMIKSDADLREQEARIANLRKQAEKEDDAANVIEVIFAAGPEEWNE